MADLFEEENDFALLTYLKGLKPEATPASSALKEWWGTVALPTLRSQALSELHRHDVFAPRLVGFMQDNSIAVTDVQQAVGRPWGDRRSKDATAFVHYIAALVPGTRASVFCSEVWSLRGSSHGEMDRNIEKYPNLGDHPDAFECMMFTMMSYDNHDNTMMQLTTIIEIQKVLGQPRHRGMWQGTRLADKVDTTDPLFGEGRMAGRFIFGTDGAKIG